MRVLKCIGATLLICASPAALACDLEAFGGAHRYFAFANIVGGNASGAERAAEDTTRLDIEPQDEASETAEPAVEPASYAVDQSPSEPPAQPSPEDDRASDGAVFR